MTADAAIRFVPSHVTGLADVEEVAVFPDRLELTSQGRRTVIEFAQIATWPWPRWLWRTLFRIGIRPRWLPVADRDWFHLPADRFFRFHTNPPIMICMPVNEWSADYASTYFVRIRMLMEAGGFHTFDLG